MRFRLALVAILAIPALVAGCSTGGGTTTVDKPDEVSLAHKLLAKLTLPAAKSVDCPSNVDAHPSTQFDCHATLANGQEVTLPLRVASVSGDHARLITSPDVVDQALAVALVYQDSSVPPTSVDCPTGLRATQGKTFDCTAKYASAKSDRITLKLLSVSPNGHQEMKVVAYHQLAG